jgi:hypothetical protein
MLITLPHVTICTYEIIRFATLLAAGFLAGGTAFFCVANDINNNIMDNTAVYIAYLSLDTAATRFRSVLHNNNVNNYHKISK